MKPYSTSPGFVQMAQFDFVTLIFLCVAVGVFIKLLSVLGTRTGHEKPPSPPLHRTQTGSADLAPLRSEKKTERIEDMQADSDAVSASDMIDRYAADNDDLRQQLLSVSAKDASFDPYDFIDGASMAYEQALNHFANGNTEDLKQLAAKPVLDRMEAALKQFESDDHRVEFQFIGMREAVIDSAKMVGTKAQVSARFVADVIMVVLDSDDRVVSGHPKQVQKRRDKWTFERGVRSKSPAWKIIKTETVSV